jgi:hypothetical protein
MKPTRLYASAAHAALTLAAAGLLAGQEPTQDIEIKITNSGYEKL